MKQEDWDAVMQTNLASVFRLSKAVLRGMMKARKGRIISIASIVGLTGNPGQANYAAAKAGIIGFTKSLAREVGSRGITVNVIAPGFIDTDMTRALERGAARRPERPDSAGQTGAAGGHRGRGGVPRSAEAAYITGETLHVNGGMYMAVRGPFDALKSQRVLSRQPERAGRQLHVQGSRRRRVHIKYAPCRHQRLAAGAFLSGACL